MSNEFKKPPLKMLQGSIKSFPYLKIQTLTWFDKHYFISNKNGFL